MLVTALLGLIVAHSSQPNSLDRAVDSWIRTKSADHHRLLILVQDLGQPKSVLVIAMVIAASCLAVRRVNGALLAVIGLLISTGLTEAVLKPLVGRRLHVTWVVYPSGHTGSVFALGAIVVMVLLAVPARRRLSKVTRAAIVAALFLVGCAVGVAMVGLDLHYFTDIIGGAAVGTGSVITAAFLLDRALRPADPGRR